MHEQTYEQRPAPESAMPRTGPDEGERDAISEAPHRSAEACRVSELCIADLHLEAIVREEQLAAVQAERAFYKLAFTEAAVQIGKLSTQLRAAREHIDEAHVNSPTLEAPMNAATQGYVFVRDHQTYHTDRDTYTALHAAARWDKLTQQHTADHVFNYGREHGFILEGPAQHAVEAPRQQANADPVATAARQGYVNVERMPFAKALSQDGDNGYGY